MRDILAGTAVLALSAWLGWSLVVQSSPAPNVAAAQAEAPSCVPCTTDEDCADKNPTLTGLYAFPEKAARRDTP